MLTWLSLCHIIRAKYKEGNCGLLIMLHIQWVGITFPSAGPSSSEVCDA